MSETDGEMPELVFVRLATARQMLDDAAVLRASGSLRSAINRAYYVMFHAASALALSRGRSFSKHSGVISFFQREFAKTGILDRLHGRALQKAFEDRSEADYQDYVRFTEEQVDARIREAAAFLCAIEAYFRSASEG